MMHKDPDPNLTSTLLALQQAEITEHHIYKKIAATQKIAHNREILDQIAQQELEHYGIWKKYTNRDVAPNAIRIWFYYLMARLLGMTFAIKLMEEWKNVPRDTIRRLSLRYPTRDMFKDEENHERELIALIDEERLKYVGSSSLASMMLLSILPVHLPASLAIQNTQIIAIPGLIMGVAASLSMGASEYLAQRSEAGSTDPLKASVLTGFTYMVTVAILILPFLVLSSPYIALLCTLLAAIVVIFLFTYYISVAKDLSFGKRFGEMLLISIGIAAISFVIGIFIRIGLNTNV